MSFLDRFGAAAAAGFEAVECQFPYAWPAAAIREQLDRHGLTLVLHNLPPGNAEAGERGLACQPGRVDEFRASVATGIAYATALGAPRVNCLAGKAPPGVGEAELRRTLIDNLRHAAAQCERAGLQLLIEPINRWDVPGYWLDRPSKALEVLAELAAPNAFLQYDVYHAQRSEGELAATLQTHLARIGHVQIADNPGRGEPGSGEIHWPFLFEHLDRIGYTGWVGCEYRPLTTTGAGLGWLQRFAA